MSSLHIDREDEIDPYFVYELRIDTPQKAGVYNTARRQGASDLQARKMANAGKIDTPEKAKAYNEARRQGGDDTDARRVANSPTRKSSSSADVKRELDKERSNTQKTANAISKSNPSPSALGSSGGLQSRFGPDNPRFQDMIMRKTEAGRKALTLRQAYANANLAYKANPNRTTLAARNNAQKAFDAAYDDWKVKHWTNANARCPECVDAMSWIEPQGPVIAKRGISEAIGRAPGVPQIVKGAGGFIADVVVGAVSGENMTGQDIANSASSNFVGVDPDKFNGDPVHDIIEGAKGVTNKVFGMGVTGIEGPSGPAGDPSKTYSDIPGVGPPKVIANFAGLRPD